MLAPKKVYMIWYYSLMLDGLLLFIDIRSIVIHQFIMHPKLDILMAVDNGIYVNIRCFFYHPKHTASTQRPYLRAWVRFLYAGAARGRDLICISSTCLVFWRVRPDCALSTSPPQALFLFYGFVNNVHMVQL